MIQFICLLLVSFINLTQFGLGSTLPALAADQGVSMVLAQPAQAMQSPATIHVFTSKTCPHCTKEKQFLRSYKQEHPEVTIYNYDIAKSANSRLLSLIAQELEVSGSGVPLTLIGNQVLIGFDSAQGIGQEIAQLVISEGQEQDQLDVAALAQANNLRPVRVSIQVSAQDSEPVAQDPEPTALQSDKPNKPTNPANQDPASTKPAAGTNSAQQATNRANSGATPTTKTATSAAEQTINIPLIGQRSVTSLSLPALTFILGFLDGFNPCAMWTLLFLISLLLGLEDRKRMWILGVAFIVASSFVYFLFMSAWLNLFLFIGFVKWVRLLIGAVALGTGGYYLYDYCVNKTGACKVDMGGRKQKVFEKLKEFAHKQSLLVAVAGMILLAFAVNLVELVCSAGLPAIYTQVLSMSDLSTWQYYAYLLFYITIFMLDDLFVFFAAMITLHQVGINTKYARYSHLIGGILMFLIGLALWFKPELLTFG
jgi:glutaredoxin